MSNTQLLLKTVGLYSLFVLIIMLYLGGYYFLSKFFVYHINNYIKTHIGNDPLLVKNFYIISIIVKFIIFFLLLKILIRATYNYIFIEEDNDCTLYNKTELFAGIISTTFFVIYEFIMFPLYFIDSLDNVLKFIIKDIKKYSGLNKSSQVSKVLSAIESDIGKEDKDFKKILYEIYTDYKEILDKNPGILDSILLKIENLLLFFVPEEFKIKSVETNITTKTFSIANELASIMAGSTIIYLIFLFMAILTVYKYIGTGFLAIICYVLIGIVFMFLMYQIIVNKLLHFSMNASQLMSEKIIIGNTFPQLVRKLEEDTLQLIKDISGLNPITKTFINKLVGNVTKKHKEKSVLCKALGEC